LRRLVIGLAICVFSTHAFALGLGKLRVKSALDEPLRAEIELTAVSASEAEAVKASLGTREDFARAGVDRPEYLRALEFEVQPGDKPVIKVTTKQAAREPFLHFVVAVEWAGGKLVREYTALLDPPLYAAGASSAVSSPQVVKPAEPAPPAAAAEAQQPGMAAMPPAAGAVLTGEYGPTQRGDTLWGIASRLEVGGARVNVFQVMIALLRENPGAFVDLNVNRLKTGQVLKIGDIQSISRITPEEARVAYQTQLEEWQGYKVKVAATGEPAGSMPAASSAPAAGKSGAQTTAASKPGGGEKAKGDDVLQIVQATLDKEKSDAAGKGAKSNQGEIIQLKNQIVTLEETLASRELENRELRERVSLLETQVQNAKRLMEVESAGLAMAQKQAAEREAAAAAKEEAAAKTETQPAVTASAAAVTAPKPEAVKAPEPPPAPPPPPQTQAAPKPAPAKAATAAPQRAAAKPRTPQKSWWEGMLDAITGSWLWMLGLIAAVVVLGIGAILFIRRRRSIAEFEESILTGTALGGHTDTTESADGTGSDTSFLSDFGMGGIGTVQADEVDPLAEAEVYLAYGRDEQAEEVLKEALQRHPTRSELKLKLLEIYQHRNDLKSFETLAEELYPAGGHGDPSVWRKVVDIGRRMNPENPLFTQEVPVTAYTGDADSTKTTAVKNKSPDSDDDTTERLFTPSGSTDPAKVPFPAPDSTLDLDDELDRITGQQMSMSQEVDERTTTQEMAAPARKAGVAADDFPPPHPPELDLDLDLDEPELDTGRRAAPASTKTTQTTQTNMKKPPAAPAKPMTMDSLDFDLTLEDEPAKQTKTVTKIKTTRGGADTDITAFDLTTVDDSQPASDEMSGDEQEKWDDAATKLDLAKAYIDMGDKAGARSIIDEVLKEGNPAQRRQAGELAAQLR